MNTEREFEQGISDIVGVFTDPIIVYPGGWMHDIIPDWLKGAITLERLMMNMRALKGEEMTGTDAEALAYMMPAVMEFPMDHDWAQIYLYLGAKEMKFHKKVEVPDDINVESLSDQQLRDLDRLKAWIYQKRIAARKDKERAERKQKKEKEAAERKALQPALFDF